MEQNQIDYLINSYSFSGTNRPDGIREGNVSPTSFPNSGIPSGLVQSYPINLLGKSELSTLDLSENATGIFPFTDLLAIPINIQNNVKGIQFDYPRALEVSVSAAVVFTINISGFDRFYNQISFGRTFTSTGNETLLIDSGIFILTHAEIESAAPLANDCTFILSTSGYAELLYTDCGYSGNLISVTRDRTSTPDFLGPQAVEDVEFSSETLFSTLNYYPASWNKNVGYFEGRPRPLLLMSPNNQNSPSNSVVTQIIWGIDNTVEQLNTFQTETYPIDNQLINGAYVGDDAPVFGASVFAVYGRQNNVTNWKGWSQ